MSNYYNEIDPYAAAWLRNLIAAGHIAPGIVDERSIEDVRPNELAGYTQCHFFAGIGIWSSALRAAGWSDTRRVWTGSCPCQPFSAAGQGAGFADQRHLWPAFQHLIKQCRPPKVLGEQVASKHTDPWIDLVHTDMEALGYAFGAVPFPAAGIGAPNVRDRVYWVADAGDDGLQGRVFGGANSQWQMVHGQARRDSSALRPCEFCGYSFDVEKLGRYGCPNCEGEPDAETASPVLAGPADCFWSDADWLIGRDGLWRPVEPGTFPLANGSPGRVGRLRAYGNGLNKKAAQTFIESVM